MIIDRLGLLTNGIGTDKTANRVNHDKGVGQSPEAEPRTILRSDTAALHSLVAKAMQSPPVRQGKIDALRAAVTDGKYALDPSDIASVMLGR